MANDKDTPPQKSVYTLAIGTWFNRLVMIGIVLLLVICGFAYAGGLFSPQRLTPSRFVDGFEHVNGVHAGFRRNHAKGVCIAGTFRGNGMGERLSKSSVFKAGSIPVIGRFALAGGQPYMADSPASVRSMALRFRLPDGEEWRTGMNNIPVFVVNSPEGFFAQLLASKHDPATGKPDPAAMKAFLEAHPETARAIAVIKAHPFSSGFDNSTFNSLDAFRFINAAGISIPVRWSMVPVRPYVPENAAQFVNGDKNDLFDALAADIEQHPLQWHLIITLGQPEDATNDATIAWPETREKVDVGTLVINHVESENTGGCRDINFDPLVLPSGIAPSDDPLLSARSAVYSQSVIRRDGETKQPGAVHVPAQPKGVEP